MRAISVLAIFIVSLSLISDACFAGQKAGQSTRKIDTDEALLQCKIASDSKAPPRLRSQGFAWCDIGIGVATRANDSKLKAKFQQLKRLAEQNLDDGLKQDARDHYRQLKTDIGL